MHHNSRAKFLHHLLGIHIHLLRGIGSDLHNRPLELLPRPHNIIQNRSEEHKSSHHHAIIHRLGRNGRSDWEETKDEDDNPESHGEDVDRNTEDPRETEGTPDECARLGGIVDAVAGADAAGAATVEQEALRDDVRSV